MSFCRRLFRRNIDNLTPQAVNVSEQSSENEDGQRFYEKDSVGTRLDTDEEGLEWFVTQGMFYDGPKIIYKFRDYEKARKALLEVPSIHQAQDSGNLVSIEVVTFGVFGEIIGHDGKPESWLAVLGGSGLSFTSWNKAREAFTRYGGDKVTEKEPSAEPSRRKDTSRNQTQPMFVREEKREYMGGKATYCWYKAPDLASAEAFLKVTPVTKELYHLVVETPEGSLARDIKGMYS